MKRFLSMLLVIVMVFSMIPQAAFAEESNPWHDSGVALKIGENTVAVNPDKEATVYYFEPTETGFYTFTGPDGYVVGISGYNWVTNLPEGTNIVEWKCTGVGQTVIIGVAGAAGDVKLTVAKTGEIHKDPDPVPYENKHTPNKANILTKDAYCYTVEAVETVNSETVVNFTADKLTPNGDFYYYNGNPVYVNFSSTKLSLTSALNNPGLKYYQYDDAGNLTAITDYRPALTEYVGGTVSGEQVLAGWTTYPLTQDLVTMLNHLDAMNGWSGGAFIPNGWIELCYLVVADHTPGDRVIDGDNYTVSCTVCEKVLETGTVEPEPTEPELGSAENPIMLELQWGDDGIMGVTTTGYSVPAGKTVYLQAYGLGGLNVVAMLSAGPNMLDGAVVMNGVEMPAVAAGTFNAVATGNPRMPTTFAVTNNSETDGKIFFNVNHILGSQMNPAKLNIGTNEAVIAADSQGYYYTWTGIEDGGILVITMAEDADWTYVANNLTSGSYGDTQWSNEDPKNPCFVMVNEGEEIQLIVNTFDPTNPYTVPEGTVKFEVDYVAPYGSEGNRAFIGFPDGQYDAENWTYGYVESGLLPDTSYYKSNFGYDKNNPQELFINGEKIEYTVEFGEDGYVEEFYTITNEGEPYVMVSVFLAKPNATLTVAFADMMGAELKQNTEGKYYVSGVVKSVDDAEKGILTIQDEEGNTLTVTGLNSYSVAYNELEVKPAAGDTVTVYGVLGQADGVAQMVNANLEAYDCAHDVKYVEAVAATCYENGNVEYWTCTKCGAAWLDEECTKNTNLKSVVTPMGHGEIIAVEAVEATCFENGNIAYWYCEDCGAAWLDAECTKNTNLKAVVLPMAHAPLTHVEAVAATCYENGNIEYWTCEVCGYAWLDAEGVQSTNLKAVVTPMGHGEIIHVPYNKPTGAKNGNLEHWYCEDCGQAWLDAECTKNTNLKAVVLPATGECDHENVQYKEAVAPGCHYNGNIEYWVCYDCESWWADEALTQVTTSKSVVLPYTGSEKLQHIDAVAATCFENGNIEHWYCPECEQFWQDEALTQVTNAKRVIVPMAHQELTHVEAVAATCFENGNIEYWTCEACDYAWLDAEGIQSTNLKAVVTPAAHAELTHVEAVAATCFENGNIEYWTCETCGYAWLDAEGVQSTNLKAVVLPMAHAPLTHVEAVAATCYENGNIEYWTCETCGFAWLDAEGVQSTNLKAVVTPMGHGEIIAVEAKEPTCEETGNIAYWYCADCGQAWLDAECTRNTNLKAVVLPIAHNILHKEAIEPGCHMTGNVEYWYCTECGYAWTDEACTQVTNLKNVVVPATGSDKVVYFEAVEPKCHYNGNMEYWYCPDCEGFWTDEACTVPSNAKNVILPAVGGEVIYFEAVEPACHYNGNVEYWYCPDCENFWTDEALTKLSNSKRVVLPATGSENVEHVEALEPTCNSLGNVEYWHCADCDQYWTDEACTVPSNAKNVLLGTLDHETVYFEAVKPGCHSNGNVEYWFCPDCEGFWTDEDCTEVTNSKSVILPATGSENVVYFEAVKPDCHFNGNVEYWYCPDCEGFWTDEACTVPSNSKNVVLPATGSENVVHFEAIEPGCHDNGQVEYWFCADCEGFWTDEACTQVTNSKSVILPATGEGNVQHFEAVAPACHYEGNVEYWHCYDCGKVWTDKAMTQLSNIKNVILPAVGGVEIHVEAKESTCTAEGNVEYWYCEECEQVWTDAALTQLSNFKNVITAKKDHTPDADGITFQISEKKTKSAGDYVAAYEFNCANCGDKIEGEAETTYEVVEDATCDEDGQGVVSAKIELNGKVFEAAKAEKKTVTIAATGHNVVHVEEVKPGCHMTGNQEHWYCTDCEIVWADEAKTQVTNHKNVIVPALGGEVVHVKAVKATCVSLGNVEHWYCEECEQVWTDEALTQLSNHKNVIIPIDDDAHTAEWKVTKEATCTAKGEKTLKCTLCNEVLEKKDIAMKDHELEWEQTKDPTCYAKGEKVHKCQVCGHVAEKKDIAMTKHVDKNKDGECDVKECKADLSNAKTGDIIMIAVVVMVLAAAAIVVLLTKKRRAK